MANKVTDEQILEFTEFVATKFASAVEGWRYSRDIGDLVHVRYKSDYTGRNHWTRRLMRALNPREIFETKKSFSYKVFGHRKRTLKAKLYSAWSHIVVNLRKENNLPDGQVNGNLMFWEEDGEYVTLMGPTVGVKVIEFLRAEPENPHAKAILAEMHRVYEMSWGDKS